MELRTTTFVSSFSENKQKTGGPVRGRPNGIWNGRLFFNLYPFLLVDKKLLIRLEY